MQRGESEQNQQDVDRAIRGMWNVRRARAWHPPASLAQVLQRSRQLALRVVLHVLAPRDGFHEARRAWQSRAQEAKQVREAHHILVEKLKVTYRTQALVQSLWSGLSQRRFE